MPRKAQEDWRRDYEAQRTKAREDALADLAKVRKALARLGVHTVTIVYEGYGDSGCIEKIVFEPQPKKLTRNIPARIEKAAYQLLPEGWEINEGSSGTLTIDIRSGKIEREHSWRVEAFETEEAEFDLAPKKGGQR